MLEEKQDGMNQTGGAPETETSAVVNEPETAKQQPQTEPQQSAEAAPKEKEDKKKKKQDKEVEKLKEQAEKLQKDLDTLKDQLLRTAAEYDNYRKRTDREKAASVSMGTAGAVEKILPVLDTLELAAAAETADEAYKKGVTMTLTMFREALGSLGVAEIEGVGAQFDPNCHCAVAREAAGEAESGSIVQVMRKGYKLGDRVIRPSMVTVAE